MKNRKTTIDLKAQYAWVIASTPKGQTALFPEGDLINELSNGYNRAKFAWYNVNSDLLRNTSATPSHITNTNQSNHQVREIYEKEIFPNKESVTGYPTVLSVANMAFYPEERGAYNYDLPNGALWNFKHNIFRPTEVFLMFLAFYRYGEKTTEYHLDFVRRYGLQ